MEKNIRVEQQGHNIQFFNGQKYKLHKNERYYSKWNRRLHREVWEYYNGEIPKDYHIHHVDGNTHNNNIENLNLIHKRLHLKFEGKKRFKNNPKFAKEFHAKGIVSAKEWHKSEQGIQWHKEHAKIYTFGVFDYPEKECLQCTKLFKPKTKQTKFCHNNCKSAFRKKQGTDNQKRICKKCGVEFECNKYNQQQNCKRGCKGV